MGICTKFSFTKLLVFLVISVSLETVQAATFTARASGDWNVSTTWSLIDPSVPGDGDIVNIPAGYTVTIPVNYAASCLRLTINSNAADISSSTTIQLAFADATSTLTVSGDPDVASEGLITINALTGTVTSGTISINVGSGILTCKSILFSGGTSTNYSQRANLVIGSGTVNVNGNTNAAATNNNVTFEGGNNGTNFKNTITIGANGVMNVRNNITGGGKLIHATSSILNIRGDLALTGTFEISGLVNVTGNKDQQITGNLTFLNLNLSNFTNSGIQTTKTINSSVGVNVRGILTIGENTEMATNGKLTLLCDQIQNASIGALLATATVNGSIKVQVFLRGGDMSYRGYKLFSSPVSNATFEQLKTYMIVHGGNRATSQSGFDTGAPNASFASVQYYYEPAAGNSSLTSYTSLPNITDVISPTTGFAYYYMGNRDGYKLTPDPSTSEYNIPEDVTIVYEGTINRGTIVKPLSWTNNNSSQDGFNLVGNPYPSAIDWLLITKNEVQPKIWTTKPDGVYATYIIDPIEGPLNMNGGSRYILPGQGFFVKTENNPTSPSLTFTETCKTSSSPTNDTGERLLSKPEIAETITVPKVNGSPEIRRHLRIKLAKQNSFSEETYIGFRSESSALNDADDVTYIGGSNIQLASLSSDTYFLAVNFMPIVDNDLTVRLRVSAGESGNFSLNLNDFATMSGFHVFLTDNYTNTKQALDENPTYNFEIDNSKSATYGSGRFVLSFEKIITLPIQMLSFSGKNELNKVNLFWKTASEQNNNHFEIIRSQDGINFKKIGSVAAVKNSSRGDYTFTDSQPYLGYNYYKLLQVDNNGASTVYGPVSVNFSFVSGGENNVKIFPNPVIQSFAVNYDGHTQNSIYYKIYNSQGQEIKTSSIFAANDNSPQDVESLASGLYILKLFDAKTNENFGTAKLLKK